jgi:thiosulfate reductase/polysulfide reductase chain A
VEEYLDHRLQSAGLSLALLKDKGLVRGTQPPIYYDEGVEPAFPTPSGKIEFYSPTLRDAGFDPVPQYVAHEEPPAGAFRLLYGRAPMHSFGRTQTNPLLSELMNENEVWLNADVARRMGVASGAWVRLRNQDGMLSNRVRVNATERIRGDCVYMVHGFGHTSRGMHPRFKRGASDSGLITRYATDPLMGGNGMNVNFVTLEPEA